MKHEPVVRQFDWKFALGTVAVSGAFAVFLFVALTFYGVI